MKEKTVKEFMRKFTEKLKREGCDNVFNPWYESDEVNDIGKEAPEIRRKNLENYLSERKNARILLLGEALSYQGGHFTGIAMTSERIILGYKKEKGILPENLCRENELRRTSKQSIREKGFSENTASIVWGKFAELEADTHDIVIWNIFPWHPYKPEKGYLSNRTPTGDEIAEGTGILKSFIGFFNFEKIIAVGNSSYNALKENGIDCNKVRHPANGGAPRFGKELAELI